jgi:glucose/arabinose dehydrogenase
MLYVAPLFLLSGPPAGRVVSFSLRLITIASCLLIWNSFTAISAATLPLGFSEVQVAGGLARAAAMEFAPDGRLFVCLQDGQLRVIKNGVLLTTPFLTVKVDSAGDRGLLGVTFDPNFSSNNFVYIYYTVPSDPAHNRISRFTASGDVALANSEVVLLDVDNLAAGTGHNGGPIRFGPDGKLYVGVGYNDNPPNAQTLDNLLGKILRLNADGSIPTDNPFYGMANGNNRAIWALGLRNPFAIAFQPGTNLMLINDVGDFTWEEINEGVAGSNYGWPINEGPTSDPRYREPVFSYRHGSTSTTGCAIVGGTFYDPAANQYPAAYVGQYFFADYCGGWIRTLSLTNGTTSDFATGIVFPLDLRVGADGSLYYLSRGAAAVFKIQYQGCSGPNSSVTARKLSPQTAAPTLHTEDNTDSAIAFDSMTLFRDPFPLTNPFNLGSDNRTGVILFADNLDLSLCEDRSAVTAEAEDAQHNTYPLSVEFVGKIPGFESVTELVVKLPDNLAVNQTVLVSITWHEMTSNKVRIRIK